MGRLLDAVEIETICRWSGKASDARFCLALQAAGEQDAKTLRAVGVWLAKQRASTSLQSGQSLDDVLNSQEVFYSHYVMKPISEADFESLKQGKFPEEK